MEDGKRRHRYSKHPAASEKCRLMLQSRVRDTKTKIAVGMYVHLRRSTDSVVV